MNISNAGKIVLSVQGSDIDRRVKHTIEESDQEKDAQKTERVVAKRRHVQNHNRDFRFRCHLAKILVERIGVMDLSFLD